MIGETRHPLYITFDTPIGNGPYNETCVWLGCTAARGKTTEESVFNAIWNKFQSMNITTRDGRPLCYYKDGAQTGSIFTTNDLLYNGDGQCTAWSDLFFTTINSQGIEGVYKYKIQPNNKIAVMNNNIYSLLGFKQKGSEFQGMSNENYIGPSELIFGNHQFNMYNNKIYDVSMKNTYSENIEDYLRNNITYIFYNWTLERCESFSPLSFNYDYSYFMSKRICNHIDNDPDCECDFENIVEVY